MTTSSLLNQPEGSIFRSIYGSTPKLTTTNYHEWCAAIKLMLQAEDALNITLGSEELPCAGRAAAMSDYRKRSGIAAAMLSSSCTNGVKHYISQMTNPMEIWLEPLTETNSANTGIGHVTLKRQFNTLKPENNDIHTSYISKLLSLCKQLLNTERPITDDDLIDKILSTLPPHYDSVVDLITHKTQGVELTIDYVLDTLKNWSVVNPTSRNKTIITINEDAAVIDDSTMETDLKPAQ
ncbi:uncharacterized protein H6S33_007210 [Morchella sextelata]|uniref:uncharacterized protein n=1 Tax=Morchella sextelata TaxID=1174677 RepID=UPI001D048520|nr:uncharacterized protein H6S33_007210 [Morchella sextelata]KAH0604179.1 hypothetical protein H6S33_007210 [Morchella sextelata]